MLYNSRLLLLFLSVLRYLIHWIALFHSDNAVGSNLFSSFLNPILFLAFEEAFHVSFIVFSLDIHFVFVSMPYGMFLRLGNFLIHLFLLMI